MKKFFLCCSLSVLFSALASAAVITWDGEGGDGLWTTNTNWAGDIIPAAADDVILDNSAVTGNYTVNLPAGNVAVTVNSLTITPAGSNTITFIIPNTNTASPVFTVSGAGDALVLNKGAIFKNSSGAPSGSTLVISNTFRINNGARYVHNTARGNASIVSQLSTAAGTEEGEFEFDVSVPTFSYIISLTGRTFGTLILSSAASAGNITYSGGGASPLNIKGNLQINADVSFSTGMSANFTIHKNFIQAASSMFNLQNSTHNNLVRIYGDIENQGTITKSGSGEPILELNGTNNQYINTTGPIQNNIKFKINNAAGITLVSPLVINNKLEFGSGKIKTDAINMLTLADGASYTGASSASFVEGPLKKIGDDDFIFPIGAGNVYAPIGISGAGNPADEFTAEYKRQNPQSTPGLGNTVENTINHISSLEYWEINRNAGASAKTIRFTVTEYSGAKNLNTLLVARFDGSQWHNEGGANFVNGPGAPPYITGTFESNSSIGNFGAFTIGTTDNFVLNPLPVKLISFNALQATANQSTLQWTLAETCLPGVMFELEKASESRVFGMIAVIEGNENKTRYEFNDNNLKPGINYYRLKIKDENGEISYSRIVSVFNGHGDRLIGFISPSVVSTMAYLTISSNIDQRIDLIVSDVQGRIWKKQYQNINKGNTTISLSLSDLQNGIYHISLITNQGFRNVIRFIKQ